MKHIIIILLLLSSFVTSTGTADSGTISPKEARQVRTQARELAEAANHQAEDAGKLHPVSFQLPSQRKKPGTAYTIARNTVFDSVV